MPTGSKARTVAPAFCSPGTISRLGLSRMSSVFGLKVMPSAAIVLPSIDPPQAATTRAAIDRSEEHTSELQSLMRISYAVFCLKKKKQDNATKYKRLHRK